MAPRGTAASVMPLLWISCATLPLLAGAVRSIVGDSANGDAAVAAGSDSGSDWCKRWLLVEYREEPKEETPSMPLRGVFHYPAGEWGSRLLFTKSLANGCKKTYTAVCAAGKAKLRVASQCPARPTREETRGFCSLVTSRSSEVEHGEIVQVVVPGQDSPVELTSGKVKVTPMKVGACKPVTTQQNFDLMSYISAPWYIQQQAVTAYLPVTKNYCVSAEYRALEKSSFFGYTIGVRNLAYEADGTVSDSGDTLRAYGTDKYDPAKLAVAPKFLPKSFAGDYWVLSYDEVEGYALISGGQPTVETEDGCRTGSGTNQAGLWIFTRAQQRNETVVQKVRGIAQAEGFDLSVLNDVDQTNCPPIPPTASV